MAVSTQPIAGVMPRAPEAIRADYRRMEESREAVRLQITALAGRERTREERQQMQVLLEALWTCDKAIEIIIMEAAAVVLWPS